MTLSRKLLPVTMLVAVSMVGACGLFETREPVQPPPPTAGCRALTGGPTAALIPNIEDFYAIPSGQSCYSSMLDTSFVFHPDGVDSVTALPQRPWDAWTDSVEARNNSNISSVQDFIHVAFTDMGSPIFPDQDTEVRFYQYELRLSVTSKPDTTRYTGQADITFHRGGDGQWRMTNWVDHRGGVTDSTWGSLRAVFRF